MSADTEGLREPVIQRVAGLKVTRAHALLGGLRSTRPVTAEGLGALGSGFIPRRAEL